MTNAVPVEGNCVVLGEAGILVRGEPGAGKSTLSRLLVERRRALGGFAALVGDDRLLVSRHGGRLVARPHPAIAGLAEHRGLGVGPTLHEAAAVLRLVVDLLAHPGPRMPSGTEREAVVLGVALPRVAGSLAEAAALAEAALSWPR